MSKAEVILTSSVVQIREYLRSLWHLSVLDIETRLRFLHFFSRRERLPTQPSECATVHVFTACAQARKSGIMAMHRLRGSINRLLWNDSSSDKIVNVYDLRNSISDWAGKIQYVNFSGSLGMEKIQASDNHSFERAEIRGGRRTCFALWTYLLVATRLGFCQNGWSAGTH